MDPVLVRGSGDWEKRSRYLDPWRTRSCPRCHSNSYMMSRRDDLCALLCDFTCQDCGWHGIVDDDAIPYSGDQRTFDRRIREVIGQILK